MACADRRVCEFEYYISCMVLTKCIDKEILKTAEEGDKATQGEREDAVVRAPSPVPVDIAHQSWSCNVSRLMNASSWLRCGELKVNPKSRSVWCKLKLHL